MNLHQLRFVREAVRQNYNLTDAAKALYTSQPGVSKAIIELEEELGVDIFKRHGKRIRGLTEPGRAILQSVELIMQEIDGLKRIRSTPFLITAILLEGTPRSMRRSRKESVTTTICCATSYR